MNIIARLIKIKTWSAIMGIQSYVVEAELAQEKAEHVERVEFQAWKKKAKK